MFIFLDAPSDSSNPEHELSILLFYQNEFTYVLCHLYTLGTWYPVSRLVSAIRSYTSLHSTHIYFESQSQFFSTCGKRTAVFGAHGHFTTQL